MRISDWSSDVCSSDLSSRRAGRRILTCLLNVDINLSSQERSRDGQLLEAPRVPFSPRRRARPPGKSAWLRHDGSERRRINHTDFNRSEEPTSELQPLLRTPYAVLSLKEQTSNTH